jgi:hypothetical protein
MEPPVTSEKLGKNEEKHEKRTKKYPNKMDLGLFWLSFQCSKT